MVPGPWALAREVNKGAGFVQPFPGEGVPSRLAMECLESGPAGPGGLPTFRIKDSDVVLRPFFSTGSLDAGPQTYFRF